MSKKTNKPTEKIDKFDKIGTRSVTNRLNQLEEVMQQGIQDLKNQVNNAPNSSENAYDISTVIADFEKKILNEISQIRMDIAKMETRNIETCQSNMCKTIIINGIPEKKDENIYGDVVNIINDKMKCDISISELDYCYRVGRVRADNSVRPISVTFISRRVRDLIFKSKKQLKNTGIFISECLVKENLLLFKKVCSELGAKQCWTWNGGIFTSVNGVRHQIRVQSDIERIRNRK